MEACREACRRQLRAQGARYQQFGRHPADGSAVESGRLFAQRRRNRAHHRGLRRMVMKRQLLLALAAAASLGAAAAFAAPVNYTLPEETAVFKPGPNLEVVQNNCTACHSADYIKTQPRGPKFKQDFWRAEVTKMIKVYGAPIDEGGVGKMGGCLTETY